MSVAVRDLTKTYASRRRNATDIAALIDVNLEARDGELLVVVGPSGSGKSTLLRCIAGLEEPDSGRVEVDGRDVTSVRPGERDVAMVFQEHALYPHLTVEANISLGLRARKVARDEIDKKVEEVARTLELTEALSRRPRELSGGERQRVALARAVVRDPRAFLFDEPLSDLDAALRMQARAEIKALQRRLGTGTIYVTHDQVEAMTLGDRVAVLRRGRLEQVDAPMALYDRPANAFVAGFLGNPAMNLVPASALGLRRDGAEVAGVRPERMRLVDAGAGRARGRVALVELLGNGALAHVELAAHRILVRTPWTETPIEGSEVGLDFADRDVRFFASEDGEAIS